MLDLVTQQSAHDETEQLDFDQFQALMEQLQTLADQDAE